MPKVAICKSEFVSRLARLRAKMQDLGLDAMFVYGDEYRKENLRYVSNFWPLFERGALVFGLEREPIILCAPEGKLLCREMSVWDDVRVVPDFLCVTVPDTIDYPLVHYTDFRQIANELKQHQPVRRMGVVGLDAMSAALTKTLQDAFEAELVDCNSVLFELRLVKSPFEIDSLTEAARIADAAYETLMQVDLVGMTEIQAAGIIEGAARREGAEHIIFNVFGSGERTHTIIGRPTDKIIEDGDMIMCALAVQYNGYVATCEMPFAAGTPTSATKKVIDVLIAAALAGYPELRPGNPMKNFVQAVKKVFREAGLEKYDAYPPLHGIGCAEAESPYPNEETQEVFRVGMTINTDISLFGLEGGSNRIEEGFVITNEGAQTLSPFVHRRCREK